MQVKLIKKKEGRLDRNTGTIINGKLKTCAYARVSSDSEDQKNSYESQLKYYRTKINSNPLWEFVEVYADEAISGTLDYKRDNFMRMIQDALEGKIDLILTKSVSRFARNTVDSLKYIRKLKEKNIGVYFEEEGINTLEMSGELLITILSAVAQQESETISSHVLLGLKMKKERGEIIAFNKCLGYKYNYETKTMEINKEEAEIVKYIFNRYCEGIGATNIAKELTKSKYKTPRGSNKWCESTIRGILKNEKYNCPRCKVIGEEIIENCFMEAYKILCYDNKEIINKFLNRVDNVIKENNSEILIHKLEMQKDEIKQKLNKILELTMDGTIEKSIYKNKKEEFNKEITKIEEQQEQLKSELEDEKRIDSGIEKIRSIFQNETIIEKFDKDVFDVLVYKVTIGETTKNGEEDPYDLSTIEIPR